MQGYSKRSINFKKIFLKYYWTHGDVLYIDWRENSQSYFHNLQALDVTPTCDAADVKSIIQLFPHSSQHVTGNSSHSLSDAPLQIIDIRTLRDFLSIRTQDMDLASLVFVKYIFESVYFFLNNPVL
jgi:adenine-specific DNA methylase